MTNPQEVLERPDNADRAFLQRIIEEGASAVALDMNPALVSLQARLLEGRQGALSIRFTAPDHSVQGNGVVSGGTLASMLDLAMAMTLLSKLPQGRTCATVSLTINMLEPGLVGDFVADARVRRLGGRIAFLEADLHDAGRTHCMASASASFAVFDVRA